MASKKTDRTQLKQYFQRNAIPTEDHFAQFINSTFNQVEDGIGKSAGGALLLEAAEDNYSTALALYDDLNNSPLWKLSLNPRGVSSASNSTNAGLSISDGGDVSRLFIDGAGNVGVGTVSPESTLHVAGAVQADGGLVIPAGQQVGGIPMFDFRTKELSRGFAKTAAGMAAIASVRFDQPVIRAQALLSNIKFHFQSIGQHVRDLYITSSCEKDANDPCLVHVTVTGLMQDERASDIATSWKHTVCVLAVVQGAYYPDPGQSDEDKSERGFPKIRPADPDQA